MPKSKRKNRLNTTIDKDLLKQFKILAVQEEKRLNQLLEPNSLSLQAVETTLQEMVKELKETRRAVERGPKKLFSVIPALSGLVIGLILSGFFFTVHYSDLLRYKFELDARAIMLSKSEDHSTKSANVEVIRDSIIDEPRELTATTPATSAGILSVSEVPAFFSVSGSAVCPTLPMPLKPERRLLSAAR